MLSASVRAGKSRIRALLCQRAERDRVAQRRNGRHAVLPPPASLAEETVNRAAFQLDGDGFGARLGRVGSKAHPTGGKKRDADDQLEVRHIAMPTELGAGRILGDEGVGQALWRATGPARGAGAQRL